MAELYNALLRSATGDAETSPTRQLIGVLRFGSRSCRQSLSRHWPPKGWL